MLGFGFDPTLSEGAVKTPIFLTSTFAYSTCEEGKLLFDYMSGRQISPEGADAGLIYTRFNNPNLADRRGAAGDPRRRRRLLGVLQRHGGDFHLDPGADRAG